MMAADLGTPPLAADLVLGAERLAGTQIIKQANVLMAHLLIPEGTDPGSLEPNLDYYLPRTSHGSSLSPATHAVLLARAGRPDQALDYLRLATAIDLDDITRTTGGGLHLANLGGIWRAMVHGFAGLSVIRPDDRALSLDPVLPEDWEELRIRVRWHGRWLRLVCRPDAVHVATDRPLRVTIRGTTTRVEAPGRWVS
jgi:trehalose/maltose hydrolase-like predicted phosphorylase